MKHLALISIVVFAVSLGACGRKGPLAPPPGAEPEASFYTPLEHD